MKDLKMNNSKIEKCFLCDQPSEHTKGSDEIDVIYVDCKTCGRYSIPGMTAHNINSIADKKKWVLSAIVKQYSETHDDYKKLPGDEIKKLLNTTNIPESPLEKMDKILFHIYSKTQYFGEEIILYPHFDYPIAFAKNQIEMTNFIWQLNNMNLVNAKNVVQGGMICKFTVEGSKRIDEMRRKIPQGNQCFVAMWFDDSLKEVWEKGFYPAIENAGYKPMRIDMKEHNNKICDEIIAEIRKSSLVVADATGDRMAVYFEAGFAQGLGIPVIWTCRKNTELRNFDTRQYKHIIWQDISEFKKELQKSIEANYPIEVDKERL